MDSSADTPTPMMLVDAPTPVTLVDAPTPMTLPVDRPSQAASVRACSISGDSVSASRDEMPAGSGHVASWSGWAELENDPVKLIHADPHMKIANIVWRSYFQPFCENGVSRTSKSTRLCPSIVFLITLRRFCARCLYFC